MLSWPSSEALVMSDADDDAGVITQVQSLEIEWTIKGISSYRGVDRRLFSPRFSVPGSEWCLKLYPNGQTKYNSVGWIGLYLLKESGPPKNANFDLGVKWQDGRIETITRSTDGVFDEAGNGDGYPKFLKKNSLSGDSLTITCTLRVKDALDITSNLIKLSDDFYEMFKSETGCDMTMKVQNESFKVNRSVLASRSPVFNAMFENDMSENNTGVVDIVDCHPGAFKDFLTYIYSGQFENASGELFELYKIAHKYDVEELKADCVQFIISKLSVENVIDVAVFADQFRDKVLKRESQKLFDENFVSIASQDKWGALLKNNSMLVNELITNMKETMDFKRK